MIQWWTGPGLGLRNRGRSNFKRAGMRHTHFPANLIILMCNSEADYLVI